MNLQKLRVFQNVVEYGRFARAAEALHISQPAVSKAVQDLEEDLGLVLLERDRHHVAATAAGKLLSGYAHSIFALEQTAESELARLRGLHSGQLVLGCTRTVSTFYMPDPIATFLTQHPGADLRMQSENTRQIEQRLLACELDLAVIEGRVSHPRIELRAWCRDDMVILAPTGHPLLSARAATPTQLSRETWVTRESGSGTRAVTQSFLADSGIVPKRWVELGGIGAILHCVAAGVGLSLVSRQAAASLLTAGQLGVVPFTPRISRPLYLAWLNDRPVTPLAAAFREHLLTHAPEST